MSVEQDHLNWQLKVNETITSIEKNIPSYQIKKLSGMKYH